MRDGDSLATLSLRHNGGRGRSVQDSVSILLRPQPGPRKMDYISIILWLADPPTAPFPVQHRRHAKIIRDWFAGKLTVCPKTAAYADVNSTSSS